MVHGRAEQSFMVLFDRCSFLVFYITAVFTLMHSCSGQSQVIGSLQPVAALIGDDIILPCKLDPVMDALDMTVEWARPDLDPRFVLVWRDGVELESKKHPSYTNRTSLFTDELKNGNISLKISKVKLSDEGTYTCFVPELSKQTTIQLIVGSVSSPTATLINRNVTGVVLQCESAGWYPQPELLWLDGEGNLLSAGPTETLRGPDDLYTVSSRVTVEKRHSNNITCRVTQRNTNQSRETHIHVPDDFFIIIIPSSPPNNLTSNPTVAIVTVISVAVVLVLIVAVFFLWKRRRNKFKNKEVSEEEGPEQMGQKKIINYKSDNSGFQVIVEEGENDPLLTAIEEENNVHGQGQQSHEDRRKPQDQSDLKTEQNIEVERPEEERNYLSALGGTVSQFKEGEQKQHEEETTGREMETERSEGEGEKTVEQIKEDSDLQESLFTGQQPEFKKEAETFHLHRETNEQQERPTESDGDIKQSDAEKKKMKRTNKQKKKKKETQKKKQKKNQRDELEAKQQIEENQMKLQSETKTEGEKDETEINTQTDKDKRHDLDSKKQDKSEAQEKHSDKKQEEDTSQKDKTRLKTQTDKDTQHCLETIKQDKSEGEPQEKASHGIKINTLGTTDWIQQQEMSEKNNTSPTVSNNVTQRTALKTKRGSSREENQMKLRSQTRTEGEKDKELLTQKDQHHQSALPVNGNQTPRSDIQPVDKKDKDDNQRNERIAEPQRSVEDNMISSGSSKFKAFQRETEEQEKRPERESKESQERIREQPEKLRGAESRGGAQEKMVNVSTDETQRKDEEKERLQIYNTTTKQQLDINQKILTEQLQESVSVTDRGAECLGGLMEEELMEVDQAPDIDQKNMKKQKYKAERELHEVRQPNTRKVKSQKESRTQIRKTSKILKELQIGDPNVIVKKLTLHQKVHSETNEREEVESMDIN